MLAARKIAAFGSLEAQANRFAVVAMDLLLDRLR
jgi:hypothetical protein